MTARQILGADDPGATASRGIALRCSDSSVMARIAPQEVPINSLSIAGRFICPGALGGAHGAMLPWSSLLVHFRSREMGTVTVRELKKKHHTSSIFDWDLKEV